MKQNILWFMFIFVPCCLSSCEFENPFLEQLLYTVTFDVDGGEPGTSTATCPPGENVALPTSNPTKKDYVFGGWYTEKNGGGAQFTASTPINADTRVYARWIKEEDAVWITFDADGGTPVPAPIVCAKGETVRSPSPNPAKKDYTFEGWYTEKNGGGTEFTSSTSVTADITVYAKWTPYCRVTFDADGGTPASTTVAYITGSTAALPSDPTRFEYVFGGWYTGQNGGGTEFTSSTSVTADITVYAKWTPYCRVTFDVDGGRPASTFKTCAPGSTAALPSNPRRSEYVFEGWYTEKNGGGTQFTSSTPVTADIRVYAKWTPYCRVTFDAGDGTPKESAATCAPGSTAALPSDPTRPEYVFSGWYTGQNGSGTQFTSSTPVTADITVYAKWTPYCRVTFDAGDGTPKESAATCAPGASVVLPSPNPTRAGYVFIGWYTEKDGGGREFTASTVVTEDIKVYAKWLPYLTVNGTLELGISRIRFPNTGGMSLRKGMALAVDLSGSQVDWSGARWEIKVDAQPVSIIGNNASRIWEVPANTQNGQYTVTVMVWIGSSLYVGNFPIVITN